MPKLFELSIDFNAEYATLRLDDPDKFTIKGDETIKYLWDDWDIESNKIDLFIPATAFTVCTENAKKLLKDEFKGLKFNPVKIVKNPKEVKAKDPSRLKWLPHDYPPLYVVTAKKTVEPLPQSSIFYDEDGFVDEIEGLSERIGNKIIPRKKGKGLFFSKSKIGDNDFFTPKKTNMLVCVDRVKRFFEKNKINHIVDILEVGEVI